MKTLKILTVLVVVVLAAVLGFNMMNFSDSQNLYENDPRELQNGNTLAMSYSPENFKIAGVQIGDRAPGFKLQNIDNSMVALSDYEDQAGVIVIFTCNHCPYSKAYEDRIIAIDKKYKVKGYPIIAINPNNPKDYPEDSFENMIKRAQDKGFTFPYLVDSRQSIYPLYGATKTPHAYLLNRENDQFTVRYIGAIDDNHQNVDKVKNHFLENAIDALIAGENIDPAYTRAIGCSIKK
ncbi:MAG: thioredoxin family protein [Nonlabens sp.]